MCCDTHMHTHIQAEVTRAQASKSKWKYQRRFTIKFLAFFYKTNCTKKVQILKLHLAKRTYAEVFKC